jgi:hypothetical protein
MVNTGLSPTHLNPIDYSSSAGCRSAAVVGGRSPPAYTIAISRFDRSGFSPHYPLRIARSRPRSIVAADPLFGQGTLLVRIE